MRGKVVLSDVGFGNLSLRPGFQLLKPNAIYCSVAQEHMALYRALAYSSQRTNKLKETSRHNFSFLLNTTILKALDFKSQFFIETVPRPKLVNLRALLDGRCASRISSRLKMRERIERAG